MPHPTMLRIISAKINATLNDIIYDIINAKMGKTSCSALLVNGVSFFFLLTNWNLNSERITALFDMTLTMSRT